MNYKKSKFKKKIRISEKNLRWIKENKDTRTMAGFLDKLINLKKNGFNKIQNQKIKDNQRTPVTH